MTRIGKLEIDDLMKARILVICLAVMLIVVSAFAYTYIGQADDVRTQTTKMIVQTGQQTCENFEMRYRAVSGECYECYYPLKNAKQELFNYVYKICYQEGLGWNRTLKYTEPLTNGQ
jgi:hypothetical protein